MQQLYERCGEKEDRAITLKNSKHFIKERDIVNYFKSYTSASKIQKISVVALVLL
jgi:hypothetical protein